MNRSVEAGPIQALELFEQAPEATMLVGPGGDILLANRHCEAVFGYDAGALCGLQVEALMPTRSRLDHLAWRRAYMEAPAPLEMGAVRPLSGLRRDGSEFPVEIRVNPLPGPSPHFIATIRDISVRRQREAERESTLEQLETICAVQGAFIRECGGEGAFPVLLDELLLATDSIFGFMGAFSRHGDGGLRLRTLAVVDGAASRHDGGEEAGAGGPRGVFGDIGSLAGDGLGGGEPCISGAMPQAPGIRSLLRVPLVVNDETVGMLGLANRYGGYSPDLVARIRPLLQSSAALMGAWRDLGRQSAVSPSREAADPASPGSRG